MQRTLSSAFALFTPAVSAHAVAAQSPRSMPTYESVVSPYVRLPRPAQRIETAR